MPAVVFSRPRPESIPWIIGVGNHEMEPLDLDGYAGVLTRFPQPYDISSGSPVVSTFTYSNVAFILLDGNDLSAEISNNNGYTHGRQTAWLRQKLAAYWAPGSGVDFIVVAFVVRPAPSVLGIGVGAGLLHQPVPGLEHLVPGDRSTHARPPEHRGSFLDIGPGPVTTEQRGHVDGKAGISHPPTEAGNVGADAGHFGHHDHCRSGTGDMHRLGHAIVTERAGGEVSQRIVLGQSSRWHK
jgi:hypothetical protein